MTAIQTALYPHLHPLPAYDGVITRLPSGKPRMPRIALILAGILVGWLLHSLTH